MRLLVVGATGMLGHMMCRVIGASSGHELFATTRRPLDPAHPLRQFLPPERWIPGIEVEREDALSPLLATVKPQVVLNCVGVIKQKKEAHAAIPSIRINSLFPYQLAEACSAAGAKLIHWSTDCVFSGQRGYYREEDAPDPVDLYGRSKLLGEVAMAPHLTIRGSLVGRELEPTASGLVEWFLSQRGQAIRGYTRAIFTGLTTFAMCQLVLALLEKRPELSGVYHVAAPPIAKSDLLSRLDRLLGTGTRISPDETFFCDRSLDGSRFAAETGIAIPDWDTMLAQLAEDAPQYERWRQWRRTG